MYLIFIFLVWIRTQNNETKLTFINHIKAIPPDSFYGIILIIQLCDAVFVLGTNFTSTSNSKQKFNISDFLQVGKHFREQGKGLCRFTSLVVNVAKLESCVPVNYKTFSRDNNKIWSSVYRGVAKTFEMFYLYKKYALLKTSLESMEVNKNCTTFLVQITKTVMQSKNRC